MKVKFILFVFPLLLHSIFLFAQSNTVPKKGAFISFPITSHDFGDIVEGDKVSYIFKYKNTGTDPLILSEVLTTCGCTATLWNKTALAPGQESEINATFSSTGKMGRQNKVITILSNATNNATTINIVCNVLQEPVKASTPNK